MFTFESGRSVLLPLARLKLLKGLIDCSFLSPKGLGGFVTNDELEHEEKTELFDALKRRRIIYCVMNPFDRLTNDFDAATAEDFTQVLDLRPGFDALLSTWSKGHSSAAKKGIREGVRVELAVTENDWKAYFRVYRDTLARWGPKATSEYTWELFRIMHGKRSDKIKLWLAKYRGQTISGALCFHHNNHVAYWHGAALREHLRLKAPHALQYHVIQHACDSGSQVYDFLPSGGHEGAVRFKNGFGAEKKPVRVYMSRIMRMADRTRKVIRRNPIFRLIMKGTGF